MAFHVIDSESETRLGGSDRFEGALDLARMLATEPVKDDRTWSSEVRDDDGQVLATLTKQGS